MTDYINRETLKKRFCGICEEYGKCQELCFDMKLINSVPAADVVEVVRCGDCKYVEPSKGRSKDKLPYFCTIHREKFSDQTEYCSFGRKKDD